LATDNSNTSPAVEAASGSVDPERRGEIENVVYKTRHSENAALKRVFINGCL